MHHNPAKCLSVQQDQIRTATELSLINCSKREGPELSERYCGCSESAAGNEQSTVPIKATVLGFSFLPKTGQSATIWPGFLQ